MLACYSPKGRTGAPAVGWTLPWSWAKATGTARPHSQLRRSGAHLRRHEVGRVAGRHEEPVLGPQLLGEAKVTDAQALGIPRLIYVEDVAGLEVPMHNLGAEGSQFSVWAGGCGSDPLPGRETSEGGPRGRDLGKQNLEGGGWASCCWYCPSPPKSLSVSQGSSDVTYPHSPPFSPLNSALHTILPNGNSIFPIAWAKILRGILVFSHNQSTTSSIGSIIKTFPEPSHFSAPLPGALVPATRITL